METLIRKVESGCSSLVMYCETSIDPATKTWTQKANTRNWCCIVTDWLTYLVFVGLRIDFN